MNSAGIMNFLFVLVILIIATLIKGSKRKDEKKRDVSQRGKDAAREERIFRNQEREKAANKAAETDFAFPSAPPVGVDDREAREQLEQLERFLESGLIDKEEYRVLKKKIEDGR